ncbi:hypothetical protein N6H13_02395 [Paenibacillus sp. CC-CFT742]|nr:hypothetical protein [Paenibacillus sp. CC-CFT742]WJH29650.1 hypothetical protein N6H13_02395 [Paenibacillus sp. CC-CFT742]
MREQYASESAERQNMRSGRGRGEEEQRGERSRRGRGHGEHHGKRGTERKRSGVVAFWFFWSKCKIEERLWPDSWVKRNMSIFVR